MFAKTILALCSICAIISCFQLPCLMYIFNFLFFFVPSHFCLTL